MKKILGPFSLFFVLMSFSFEEDTLSWDNEITHKDLSSFAAQNSKLSKAKGDYLKNLGYYKEMLEEFTWNNKKRTVEDWLREGAFLEDAGSKWDALLGKARFTNHFHNPLPPKPWATAGLSDLQSGESALVWAQDSAKQSVSLGKDWSWQAVRNFFNKALTKTEKVDRQAYFAQTFQGLGYQMHLVQDMSQPAHVRNDAHPMDGAGWVDGLETWAKKSPDKIKTFATTTTTGVFPQVALNTNVAGYVPTSQFIDTNQYDGTNPGTSLSWGLSEYTNSNFVSDDTIFTENTATTDKHYFPYPRYSSESYETYLVDYSSTKKRIYIKKKASGETIEHFATTGPLRKYLNFDPELQKKELKLDSAVHEDYTKKLIPRAVGYSAALLNYFFRGKINTMQTGTNSFKIGNLSDEVISGNTGSFRLFEDNSSGTRHEVPLAFKDENGGDLGSSSLITIPSMSMSTFTVTLDSTSTNTTGTYMLVFRGKLGNEEGAVIGQKITPHFLTHVEVIKDDVSQWDIYEYDLLGNRIASITGSLPRGIAYYDGLPSPANPDLLLFIADDNTCSQGYSCLHLFTKSTGQVLTFGKFGVYWWSKDGKKIYGQDEYYDFLTGTWSSLPMQQCQSQYLVSYSAMSPDETKMASEVIAYNPITRAYDQHDIAIFTNWNMSGVVDMNTMSVVPVNNTSCTAYQNDETFMDAAPDYHPSADKIVFSSNKGGSYDSGYLDTVPYNAYVVEGSSVSQLTHAQAGRYGFYEASWSPDGEQMLLGGDDNYGFAKIYLMPAAGGTPTLITSEGEDHYYPKWIRYMK